MIVLIDQDGVLAQFKKTVLDTWNIIYPDEPAIKYEDSKGHKLEDDFLPEQLERLEDIMTRQGFFSRLPVIEGAVEAVHEMLDMGIDVRICSSPLTKNKHCASEKFLWVKNALGRDLHRRLILTKDKTYVKGDFLIDDNSKIKGMCMPTWQHIVFDAPYNREVSNKRIIGWKNWKEVLGI